MKKKRYLRKGISYALIVMTMFMFILWASIDDYEFSFMPYYLLGWLVIALNGYIIYKYVNPKYYLEKGEE